MKRIKQVKWRDKFKHLRFMMGRLCKTAKQTICQYIFAVVAVAARAVVADDDDADSLRENIKIQIRFVSECLNGRICERNLCLLCMCLFVLYTYENYARKIVCASVSFSRNACALRLWVKLRYISIPFRGRRLYCRYTYASYMYKRWWWSMWALPMFM